MTVIQKLKFELLPSMLSVYIALAIKITIAQLRTCKTRTVNVAYKGFYVFSREKNKCTIHIIFLISKNL